VVESISVAKRVPADLESTMNLRNKLTLTACLLMAALASTSVIAQDVDSKTQTVPEAVEKQETKSSEAESWSFDDLPKRPTSAREQEIIDKIVGVVTKKFDSIEDAFSNLDLDENGKLCRSEVSRLLKLAKLSRLVRVIATGRLIERYDVSKDESIQWPEFNFAITKAIDKAEKLANQTVQRQP